VLDPYVCDERDLGDEFQQLSEGDFSPRDLADLQPNARTRERELRNAGLQRARVVLFKQVLPHPPFDPQVNVVCEALEFSSPQQAEAFVADRQPNAASLAVLLITDQDLSAAEIREPESLSLSGAQREFDATYAAEGEPSTIVIVVRATDRFVIAVSAGGPGVTQDRAGGAIVAALNCVVARAGGGGCHL
jgi:hypothetical protein